MAAHVFYWAGCAGNLVSDDDDGGSRKKTHTQHGADFMIFREDTASMSACSILPSWNVLLSIIMWYNCSPAGKWEKKQTRRTKSIASCVRCEIWHSVQCFHDLIYILSNRDRSARKLSVLTEKDRCRGVVFEAFSSRTPLTLFATLRAYILFWVTLNKFSCSSLSSRKWIDVVCSCFVRYCSIFYWVCLEIKV